MLKSSETILQFEAYRIISKVAREHSIPMITGNGTFIAYLIGYMGLNPLPSHYYCPCCGKSECHNNYNQFGIDLPPKNCSCGNQMISMGIDIPFDCVWGSKKQKENRRQGYYPAFRSFLHKNPPESIIDFQGDFILSST